MAKRYRKTEWGVKVTNFVQRHGLTLKTLAEQSGVSYNTLLTVRIGKTTGELAAVEEKVEKFMQDYEAAIAAAKPKDEWEEAATCI